MPRLTISILVLAMIATGCNKVSAAEPKVADLAETKYLAFQLMTGLHGYAGPQPLPGHFALSKAQLEEFVHDVVKAIGTTGDARHKLGFTVGPLCFDMSDEETRQFIHDSFAVARENDVAVAFHIDDSISWGEREDLLSNPDNVETADWRQEPNTGRRADWGPEPTRFPPQMCFNSPDIQAAVKKRASLIGAEVKQEMDALKASGKEHLFAGVIAGWETQIGRDFETDRPLGYRALSHRGFSEGNPPKDPDLERVKIVKEFMELWANSLHAAGIPREKVFCHIAFTDQGLRAADAKNSYAQKVAFALPEVAFSSAYRPGFSTYPEGATFKQIYAVLAQHGSPGWISAEGTNVSPTSMPGEPTMETYLGRMFNHGAVMVNIFSWGIGGEAMRDNFFRRATENPEALGAYAKFLRGEPLVESAARGFSGPGFQDKMRRIEAELSGWVQKSGQQAKAMPLVQKLTSLVKEHRFQEADHVADELLALMKGESPGESKAEPSTVVESLPSKIQKIQSGLPAWIGADSDKKNKATALMQQLQQHLKAKNFEGAEKTADSILKMMGVGVEGAENKPPQTPPSSPPSDDATKRLTDKIGRIKEGVQKWTASGRDISEIHTTMEEKFKPLMEAGKMAEAEAELDRVLEQLCGLGPSKVSDAEPDYVIFSIMGTGMDPNESTETEDYKIRISLEELKGEFGRQRRGKGRYVGFSVVLFPTLNLKLEQLKSRVIFALDAAERNEVPVFFHLDDEHFWFKSPELWQNPEMVEWSTFPKPGETRGPVVPRYWLDWGDPPSVFPMPFPCFQSPALRAEMGKRLKCIAEPIAQRLEDWSQQGKEYLFAGVASGNETRIPDYRHGYTSYVGNPEEAQGRDVTQTPPKMVRMRQDELVPLGYHSLYARGYDQQSIERLARERGKNEDQVVLELLDEVAHDYAEFQAKTLNEAGIPKERIYTHFSSTGRPAQPEVTKISLKNRQPGSLGGSCNLPPPVEAAVNNYSRPGFTIVHDSVNLKDLAAQLGKAHAAQEGGAWAAVESYVTTAQPGLPQTEDQYEEYLGGLLSHGAKVVNVYGWNIPLAAKSPYAVKSSGVIPVVKRWLAGAHLPDTWERSMQAVSIQAKMAQFQEAIREAANRGSNPGPVVKSVQKEIEPLIRAGKYAEAEAALDRAIVQLQGRERLPPRKGEQEF